MTYSHEVEHMCVVKKGPNHGPAPIPEEGKWVKSKEIVDISGLTHGIGWCAPQQGACKLTLNVKEGIIQVSFGSKFRFCHQMYRKSQQLLHPFQIVKIISGRGQYRTPLFGIPHRQQGQLGRHLPGGGRWHIIDFTASQRQVMFRVE